MNVSVDTYTQQILNYGTNWADLSLLDPAQAINQQQAVKDFLDQRPLKLVYAQLYETAKPGAVRLIYQPSNDPAIAAYDMLDAVTGKLMDWQGKPAGTQPQAYHFNDVAGNFAEKEIRFLGEGG